MSFGCRASCSESCQPARLNFNEMKDLLSKEVRKYLHTTKYGHFSTYLMVTENLPNLGCLRGKTLNPNLFRSALFLRVVVPCFSSLCYST